MSRYRFIDRHRRGVPVRELCTVLRVAPSSCYTWRTRRQQPVTGWERAVVRAFQRHGRRYGTRRLRAELQAEGHRVGRWRIRRVLQAHGLQAQQPRSFVPRTTDSAHGRRVAPNRLLGQPRPTAPDPTLPSLITHPTTSKPISKQRPNSVRLTWTTSHGVGTDVRTSLPSCLMVFS
ncbi:IS3 family transposase [Hymenobacter sp. B81]|uniref:IS3 family transposase n=1 Tax=Hymenobacter sp. B81 TaxID=3344878 RepID=UPI0037DCA428